MMISIIRTPHAAQLTTVLEYVPSPVYSTHTAALDAARKRTCRRPASRLTWKRHCMRYGYMYEMRAHNVMCHVPATSSEQVMDMDVGCWMWVVVWMLGSR
jgi:hypothetical protein